MSQEEFEPSDEYVQKAIDDVTKQMEDHPNNPESEEANKAPEADKKEENKE